MSDERLRQAEELSDAITAVPGWKERLQEAAERLDEQVCPHCNRTQLECADYSEGLEIWCSPEGDDRKWHFGCLLVHIAGVDPWGIRVDD